MTPKFLPRLIHLITPIKLKVCRIPECLTSVQDWMFTNKLKLNPDKTEFMLIGNKCHRKKINPEFPVEILNNLISPAAHAKNLGIGLFNSSSRRRRSHGHRKGNDYFKHQHVDALYLNKLYQKEDGLHRIRTTLYCIPLNRLRKLSEESLSYKSKRKIADHLYYIIDDIAQHRLYKPVMVDSSLPDRYFLKINFDNKGIDLLNLPNVFHSKKVVNNIPVYFKNKIPPCISYKYTKQSVQNFLTIIKLLRIFRWILLDLVLICVNVLLQIIYIGLMAMYSLVIYPSLRTRS